MKLTVLAVAAASLLSGCVVYANGNGGWGDDDLNYEKRELSLATEGLDELEIEAGSGYLEVYGEPGRTSIDVVAEIHYHDRDDIELTLTQNGDEAELISKISSSSWGDGSPRIDLMVYMPESMDLDVNDGSGSIAIRNIKANIEVEDGSGSLEIADIVGDVEVDDGSGSIDIRDIQGNLRVDDGSGSMDIKDVSGKVTLDDGSGSINVKNVGGLKIIDDGSGSVTTKNVGDY